MKRFDVKEQDVEKTADEDQKPRWTLKRWLKIALIVLAVAALGVLVYQICTAEPQEPDEGYIVDPNDLDEYRVDIKSHRVVELGDGKKAIVVRYVCTEKNQRAEEDFSFDEAFVYGAKQNEIVLTEVKELPESAGFDLEARYKPIGKGETVEVEIAYELHDDQTDVTANISVLGRVINRKSFEKILKIR